MKIFRLLGILLIVVFLASCATVQTAQDVVPTNKIFFEGSYSKVYSRAVSTLMGLKWQISYSNKDEGLIQARTPINLWTWGDLVTVYVIEEEPNKIRVEVTSASHQQYDWGKNKDNIQKFYSALEANLKGQLLEDKVENPLTSEKEKQERDYRASCKLEILSSHWSKSYGWAIYEGQVKNISSSKLENVQAIVTWYDKNGNMITSSSALIEYNPILPGQTSPFKVMKTYNPAMEKAGVEFSHLMGGKIRVYHKR